jgi:hypothetical protein
MSKMAELDFTIRDMLAADYAPAAISVRLGIPVYFVYDVLEYEQDLADSSLDDAVNSDG